MKYETIKTAILTILVFLSIFLTWNLWTFQPNYKTMENNNTVAEVSMSEKQEVKKTIRPDMVLYHKQGKNYGTTRTDELDKLLREIGSWKFSNVKGIAEKPNSLNNLIHGSGNVEIIFPADVPIELYRDVLSFKEKKIPPFNFDRIIINVESMDKGNGTVYFVSTNNDLVFSSRVSSASIKNFNKNYYEASSRYPSYFGYTLTDKRTIFLPEDPTEMMVYKYLPATLNSEDFKNTLFHDPSFVQPTIFSNGEEYTNGSSKMTVDYDKNILLYVNPNASSYYVENPRNLIKRSIDFVNEHGGWTDDYRYAEKDDPSHRVTFRLYSEEGYPVFNEDGLSEITETWGKSDITKYMRSNISLDLPLKTEMQKVTRQSGHAVLQYIQNQNDFRPDLLENIVLGYELERDTQESKLILLEPVWFYQYDKKWHQLPLEETEGDE